MIAVSPSEMEIILEIIEKHVPCCHVLAFGSRFKGTHSDASDLDLAVVSEDKLDIFVIERMKDDFMESDIPYKIDILDYHKVSPAFREIIDAGHEIIRQCWQ